MTRHKVESKPAQEKPEGELRAPVDLPLNEKKKKKKKKTDVSLSLLGGGKVTLEGLNFPTTILPIPSIAKPKMAVDASDTVIRSFANVIEQYFGEFVLDDEDIKEVVQYVNSQQLDSNWWSIGDFLHGKLVEANYNKSGKCPTTMEG